MIDIRRRVLARITRLVDVGDDELAALLWAFAYFFCLLGGYYILRPMRDEMGIAGGVENLQWLFTGTLLGMLAAVPLFGWIAARFPRRQFVPWIYWFFALNILGFFLLFRSGITHAYVARAFFIWVSVYNLFVVSVFWSFMADIFDSGRAKRLFGFIAAGGTTGALTGPVVTATLAAPLGATNLLPIAAGLLLLAILCVRRLSAWQKATGAQGEASRDAESPMGGSVVAGITLVARSPYLLGICLLILFYTTLSTFLYFQQAEIVRDSFDTPEARTAVFALVDFAVNAATLLCQLFVTGRLVKWIGIGYALATIPLVVAIGFLAIGFAPVAAVLLLVQVVRRAGNYAIMRPAREMLFTVVGREEKYKAKNFIDTTVYRGGDAVSAWAYSGLGALGLNLSSIAFVAVPLALVWAAVGYSLGRRREQLAADQIIE